MSRVGITLCLIYTMLTALCLCLAISASGDEKGVSVFLHLPFSFHGWLFMESGLSDVLAPLDWVVAYTIYHGITLILLYLLGWLLGKYFSWAFKSLR